MKKIIYLDNAATTQMYPEVLAAMEPYMSDDFGNPSSAYDLGDSARIALEISRERIAKCIGANADEIFFTSGGSESDNWVIKMLGKNRIVTSKIEHHAVLNSCKFMEKQGCEVKYISVDKQGVVDLDEVKSELSERTNLLSVMYANNEIGTIQPVQELGNIAHKKGCVFHTDAVQAVGHIPVDLKRTPIDLLGGSGHKFHGPKGVGFLFVRRDVELPCFISGGKQERGIRAGTENVAGIVGMATALEISTDDIYRKMEKVKKLRNYFINRVMKEIPSCILNGSPTKRLPGNVNLSFKKIDSQTLLVLLDEAGICASAGSACNTGKRRTSHVIEAINVPNEYKYGTIRFTLDEKNTEEEINYVVENLKKINEMWAI